MAETRIGHLRHSERLSSSSIEKHGGARESLVSPNRRTLLTTVAKFRSARPGKASRLTIRDCHETSHGRGTICAWRT